MLRAGLLSSLLVILFTFTSCQTGSAVSNAPPAPLGYVDLDELLTDIALVQFDESRRFRAGRINVHDGDRMRASLYNIRELYMPLSVPENFPLIRIGVDFHTTNDQVRFLYEISGYTDPSLRTARFVWRRDRPNNELFFSSNVHDSGRIRWSQHGYEFEAHLPTYFPEEEIANFVNAQPVTTWEIQGNAVSVSIQGMENVNIFDENGYEIVSITTPRSSFFTILWSTDHHLEHHSLYRSNGENLSRVGYSWLVDASSSRRQYVLKPGVYTFYVEGIVGNPDLLIRHFAEREIVSSVSYRREFRRQSFSGFTVTVTPDNNGSGDTVAIDLSSF